MLQLCRRKGYVSEYYIAGNEGENLRKFRSLKPIRESFLCEIVSDCHVTSHNSHV